MGKLNHHEVSLLGAKASGEANKKRALERYYKNPNYCQWCGKVIHPKVEQKSCVAEAYSKKFCGRSCAASANNSKCPKKSALTHGQCKKCGETIAFKKTRKGYSRRKFCDICLPSVVRDNGYKSIRKRGWRTLGKPIEECTKQELRDLMPNYNYFGSMVGKHARKVYLASDKPAQCRICGYSYHIDVCHIKGIADFRDDTLIGEINHLSNLVALCKNHHKEFDDQFIVLPEDY